METSINAIGKNLFVRTLTIFTQCEKFSSISQIGFIHGVFPFKKEMKFCAACAIAYRSKLNELN